VTDALRPLSLVRVEGGVRREQRDQVAHEEPLEIQVNGASVAVLMRSPGDDEDLVRGFLITERVIGSIKDIDTLRHCTTVPDPEAEENVMQVRLRAGVPFDLERLRRHTFASSSCGVCGKATIENACATAGPLSSDVRVPARWLATLPDGLRATQLAFEQSGGVHAAGLWQADGPMIVAREDVGRHNAVDKVVGAISQTHVDTLRTVLVVSGRVSFELVQKVVAARIPVIAGVSAPTSLAVRMADALGVTLLGFVRGDAMNVYSHADRIVT
jgi:FdhD protein